jgi:hypothetical protein
MNSPSRPFGCFFLLLLLLGLAPADAKPIRLRARTVDTHPAPAARSAAAADALSLAPAARSDGRAAYLVQFSANVPDDHTERLRQVGATPVGYVPDDALIVLAPPNRAAELASLPSVRWVGPYLPQDKLAPELSSPPPAAKLRNAVDVVASVLRPGYVDAVAEAVERLGGAVVHRAPGKRWGTVRAHLPADALPELAALAEVEWIEPFVQPELHNDVAVDAPRMNVRTVWTNHNLRGQGQIVAMADSGLDVGDPDEIHPDFEGRILAGFGWVGAGDWKDYMGHGTHVAGSVLGSGAAYSNGLFQGAAPEASLVVQAIGPLTNASSAVYPPTPLNLLFEQAREAGARIHTDSWGSSVAGAYTSHSRELDEFAWDFDDVLVLFSAGNSGVDVNPTDGIIDAGSIGAPGTAKNALTVGAAESDRPAGSGGYSSNPYATGRWAADYPTNPIAEDLISTPWDGARQGMAGFSSRGPCLDGRTKPDIVAPGTDIVSTRSRMPGASALWGTGSGVLGNVASNFYAFCGGTSMSTPLSAGAAAVARQYLGDVRGMTNPSAAMLKALLVNGALSLGPGQYGDGAAREIPDGPRPNSVEGWGQVNLGRSLFPEGARTNVFWDRQAIATGRTNRYELVVEGAGDLAVTLAWSDYPASLSAAQQLVNDLDLRIVTPSQAVLHPRGAAGPDRTNNLLGIDLASPELGTHWIEVVGHNVPMGPQKYALMAQGEIRPISAVEIVGAWIEPAFPVNGQTVSAFATVGTGSNDLLDVVAAYRVNGGPWRYATLELDSLGGQTRNYRGELASFDSRDQLEYYVYAMDPQIGAISFPVQTANVGSSTIYVSPDAVPEWPYDSWTNAFTNLFDAVAYARNGYSVWVSNGIYAGDTLVLDKTIALQSLNGPGATAIDGQGQRRCAAIDADASVAGFTFLNGFSAQSGGAVSMTAGTLSNCVVRSSESSIDGGGLRMQGGLVVRSLVAGNFAMRYGGGVLVQAGAIRESLVVGNLARGDGGGIEFWGGEVLNCTLSANHAGSFGGGIDVGDAGTLLNCVVYGNTCQGEGDNWYKWVDEGLFYTCTSPDPNDEGSFDADPLFADPDAGDYRLQSAAGRYLPATGAWTNDPATSPAIDRGWPGSPFEAEPAPNGSRINLGAYGGTPQASKSPLLSIDPAQTNLPSAAATNLQIDVAANVAWSAAATNAPWILLSADSGDGNGAILFGVAENASPDARTGTLHVAGGGIVATCTVVQAGHLPDPAWDDGFQDLGNGWRRLAWFGDYAPVGGDGWLWHNRHGFWYAAPGGTPDDVFFFALDMGWLWTGENTYPFLYRFSDDAWLWYNGQTQPRRFFNASDNQWEQWP